MRILLLPLLALFLTGCVVDTTAKDLPQVYSDYHFDDKKIVIEPYTKFFDVNGFNDYVNYKAYTTYEQAAFLKSSMVHIRAELNDVEADEVIVSIGERHEINEQILYDLRISVKVNEEAIEKMGVQVTRLTLYLQDNELLTTGHSRISILTEKKLYNIEFGGDQDAEHVVYSFINRSAEDVTLKRLFVEGVNGVQIDLFEGPTQMLSNGEELRLVQKFATYEEQNIQGPLGIYAQFTDDTIQFIDMREYILHKQREQILQELAFQ